MTDKRSLRAELKKRRSEMSTEERTAADRIIAERVSACCMYRSSDALLVYVSSQFEVGTYDIINRAFSDGKRVYAPRCISGTNKMVFCRISSFEDLECGSWGISEPKQYCEEFSGADKALCITPALAYDLSGFRIGFGKGYYDRYLSSFKGSKMGICYDSFIVDNVFRDSFDVPVDMIITEKREIIIDDEREE